MERIQVYIVDDHPFIRLGVSQILNQEHDMFVCGESGEFQQSKEEIARLNPHVVLIDLSLKNDNGIDLIQYLSEHYPNIAIVVLSMHDELIYVKHAIEAGAKGYFHKNESVENLPYAIRKIMSGGNYFSEEISNTLMRLIMDRSAETDRLHILTPRERVIFQYLGNKKNRNDISKTLFISPKTVSSHIENIKDKLNIESTDALIQFAIQWNKKI